MARRNKRVLHFLHIGKTGGTAVKSALKPYAIGHFFIFLHEHEMLLKHVPAGERAIFFLRDPITRFVSGFYSRLRQGRPKFFFPWSPEEKSAFERFTTPNQLALALSSDNPDERAVAEFAMRNVMHVRDVYSRWFDNEAYFLSRLDDIFFIGFQETLGNDFENLKSRLQLPGNIQLPTGEIDSHKTPQHFDKKLDSKAIENLTNWYRDDIRFYDLCRKLVAENKIAGPQAKSGFGGSSAC